MVRTCRQEGGFTLLEVLIAFIIAAIALGVLFSGAIEGLRTSRVAVRYEEAVARARSHLAASGVSPMEGDQNGDDGSGFHWRVRTQLTDRATPKDFVANPLEQAIEQRASPATAPTLALYAITVWVSWREDGQTREVRLDSESLKVIPGSSR